MTNLIIFGTPNYKNAINSLIKSSKNYFDKVHIFSPNDIDEEFFKKNEIILNQKRGAGFWLWKPYFIYKVLENVKVDDIVFYVDAGNIFVSNPNILYDRFVVNNGIILFDNRDGKNDGKCHLNVYWTKRDCSVVMNLDTNQHLYNTHCNASYQIYKKNDNSLTFVKEFLDWCTNDDILTDKPTKHQNLPEFIDHRHDQSILSLLTSKYEIKLEIDPSEWGNKSLRNFPQIFKHHRNPNYTI